MTKLICLLAGIVACAFFAATPVQARDTAQVRLRDAERELNQANAPDRLNLASQRCNEAIDQRDGPQASTWCLAAAQAADRTHRREHGAYTTREIDVLRDAAWLVAVKGVQEPPWRDSRAFFRNVTMGDQADQLRFDAYQLLGDFRCQCVPSVSLPALLSALGTRVQDYETVADAREHAFDVLLNQPHTPDRLWAAAALGHTTNIGLHARDNLDGARAEARGVAARLEPLIAEARGLTGRDSALLPVLLYAYGISLKYADDLPGAVAAFDEARPICDRQIWANADTCLDLNVEAVATQIALTERSTHPEWVDLQTPRLLSGPEAQAYESDEPCSALVLGDIDELGQLTNLRIAYASDAATCRAYALRHAAGIRYAPAAQATANERRRDVRVRITVYLE